MRILRTATVMGLFLFLFLASEASRAETQTFDTEASAAADGWVEFGSRENQFDFGFSATNNAEGASGSGEGGGLLARSGPRGYYADVSETTRSADLADLNATGRFKIQDENFDGEWYFGWFDSSAAEVDEQDYLGIHVLEQRAEGWRVLAGINENDTPPAEADLLFIPDDTTFDFALNWDIDGGDNAGEGKLTLTLRTLDGSESFESIAQDSAADINFNAFGLLSNSQAPRDDFGNFWFDDLEYTLDERKAPGDFNEDGVVDLADFQILASNFGTGTTFAQGDNNFDGRVDLKDFVEFRPLFQAAQSQGAATVPEPGSLGLLSLAAGLLLARRRNP